MIMASVPSQLSPKGEDWAAKPDRCASGGIMSDRMAVKIAIDIMHVPSQVRLVRSEPLPNDVHMFCELRRVMMRRSAAVALTVARSRPCGRPPLSSSNKSYLLLSSDSYRVLGVSPQASASELRRNVALLLRWLHPGFGSPRGAFDFHRSGDGGLERCEDPERRAAYDEILQSSVEKGYRRKGVGRAPGDSVDRPAPRSVDAIGFFRRALSIFWIGRWSGEVNSA